MALRIGGKLGKWLFNFLTKRKQQVVISGEKSSVTNVTSGVPQGAVLGPILFLIYISDIGENISPMKKIYVDDTKVKKPIKNVEDVESLQLDLTKLYEWAKSNNMVFNGTKFQVVRYGQNEELKEDTLYFTEDTGDIIERFDKLRDLGVILNEEATFSDHIQHVEKKVRQKIGWVLRTFYTRNAGFMKILYKSLIVPHVDYCSQLWMPIQATQIQSIEKLQKDFLNKIPAVRELNYWEQLKQLKMISLQRRLERYTVLYVWKILEGLSPNCGIEVKMEGGRLGRTCSIPSRNSKAKASVQSMREQTFQVNGPKLFNSLPTKLRNMTKCPLEDFKLALDNYLSKIPDEPNVSGLTPGGCTAEARASNSILDQSKRIPPTGHGIGG